MPALTRLHDKVTVNPADYLSAGTYTDVDTFAEAINEGFLGRIRSLITITQEHMRAKGLTFQKYIIEAGYDYDDNPCFSVSFYREETAKEQESREREELRVAAARLKAREKQDAEDRKIYERLKKKYG